ncbi:MAG: amidohydrolase family protein [Clostridia bacterium]|nr:amidohydrolase family protein [Clostridia bacterium]
MKVFDIHVHIYPEKVALKASESIGRFYDGIRMHGNGRLEDYLRMMDAAGVERFAAHSVALTPHNVDRINDFIMDSYRRYPDRIVPFAAIHPDMEDLPGAVDKMVKMGFRGIKIHPDMQKFALDEERARPMMEAVAGKLPILIHCGDYRYDYDGPERLLHLHEMLPDLKIIAAHFGGWGEWDRAAELLPGHEGIVVDTCSSLYKFSKDKAVDMIRKLGAENVFFGSDYPMWEPKDELERFMQLNLTDREREDILWNNAERMFQL